MYLSNRKKLIIPMLLPALILLGVFFFWPAVQTVWVSFTDWSGVLRTNTFIGLENYKRLLDDSFFQLAFLNTLLFFVIYAVLTFPMTILLSLALRSIPKGRRFFQFIVFSPVVLSVVVAAVIWKFLANPDFGLFNELLRVVGLDALTKPWLGDPSTALLIIILTSIWHGIGTWVILVMAGMDRIPGEIQEAAVIDGANEWQTFRYITLPMLWEVLQSLLILCFVQAMQAFSFIYIMTRGGPQGKTEVMGSYLYKMAFEGNRFAYGSAMSVIMVVVIIIVSIIGNRLLKRENLQF